MAKTYEIDGIVPVIDPTSFVHPDAVVIGDVIIGPACYVGPCACLRGDFGRIRLSTGVNVQDNCVVHTFPQSEVLIGENGHISHGAVLHGCTIGENALIGMNSVVMDHVVIGRNSFVAAMAFVKSGMQVGENRLVAGMPAREVRPLTEEELLWKLKATATYQKLAVRSLASLKEALPLASEPAERRTGTFSREDAITLYREKLQIPD